MFTIKRIEIRTNLPFETNKCIAYIYPDDNEGWRDPYGGVFSDEEKKRLDEELYGEKGYINLGSKYYYDLKIKVFKQ